MAALLFAGLAALPIFESLSRPKPVRSHHLPPDLAPTPDDAKFTKGWTSSLYYRMADAFSLVKSLPRAVYIDERLQFPSDAYILARVDVEACSNSYGSSKAHRGVLLINVEGKAMLLHANTPRPDRIYKKLCGSPDAPNEVVLNETLPDQTAILIDELKGPAKMWVSDVRMEGLHMDPKLLGAWLEAVMDGEYPAQSKSCWGFADLFFGAGFGLGKSVVGAVKVIRFGTKTKRADNFLAEFDGFIDRHTKRRYDTFRGEATGIRTLHLRPMADEEKVDRGLEERSEQAARASILAQHKAEMNSSRQRREAARVSQQNATAAFYAGICVMLVFFYPSNVWRLVVEESLLALKGLGSAAVLLVVSAVVCILLLRPRSFSVAGAIVGLIELWFARWLLLSAGKFLLLVGPLALSYFYSWKAKTLPVLPSMAWLTLAALPPSYIGRSGETFKLVLPVVAIFTLRETILHLSSSWRKGSFDMLLAVVFSVFLYFLSAFVPE